MSSPRRDGKPSFWVTQIAKVLVGDQPCLLAPWLSGHFHLEKSRRDSTSLATWKANHTDLLQSTVERYRAEGWKCDVERFFKIEGNTAILSGKADLIVQLKDHRPRIVDVKSGQPQESHVAQVCLEMIAIPLAWGVPMTFEGLVIYPDHKVQASPQDAEGLASRAFWMVKQLALSSRPPASPSEQSCRFCDVPEDLCPDRWKVATDQPAAQTMFF